MLVGSQKNFLTLGELAILLIPNATKKAPRTGPTQETRIYTANGDRTDTTLNSRASLPTAFVWQAAHSCCTWERICKSSTLCAVQPRFSCRRTRQIHAAIAAKKINSRRMEHRDGMGTMTRMSKTEICPRTFTCRDGSRQQNSPHLTHTLLHSLTAPQNFCE